MTLLLCAPVCTLLVTFLLFVPVLCVSGFGERGVLCLRSWAGCLLILSFMPSVSFNMFQFPSSMYVCVKWIIRASMRVEGAAVEAATSLSPPRLPLPSFCVTLSFIRSLFHFLFHLTPSLSLLTPSPPHPCTPPLPTPCNELTHRKL